MGILFVGTIVYRLGLLGCLSLGIGFLWILPYIKTTEAEYYRKLTGDQSKTELVNKGTRKIDKTTSFGN